MAASYAEAKELCSIARNQDKLLAVYHNRQVTAARAGPESEAELGGRAATLACLLVYGEGATCSKTVWCYHDRVLAFDDSQAVPCRLQLPLNCLVGSCAGYSPMCSWVADTAAAAAQYSQAPVSTCCMFYYGVSQLPGHVVLDIPPAGAGMVTS